MTIASTTLITGFATAMGAQVSSITTSIFPIVLVVAGVPFAFYVLRKIIALVPKR